MNGLPPIVDPALRDVLQQHAQEIYATMNCHQLGTIVSFDSNKQTASISLNVQRVVYNQQVQADPLSNQPTPTTPNVINYPVLVDCPVFVLTGGGSYLTMPIKAGDTCLVLFNDRDIDSWFASGAVVPPNSARMHSLSDGMAIVGFRSLANVLSGYSENVVLHSDALVKISNENTTLKLALDQLMDTLISWVNSGGSTPNVTTITNLTATKATIDSLLA